MITKKEMESIYRRYHHPRYLDEWDPLGCVRKFGDDENREVAGLFSAALARGQVKTIIRNIKLLIDDKMGGEPAAFVRETSYKEKRGVLAGFKHRFNDGDDVAALLEAVKAVMSRHGSLGGCFSDCLARSGGQLKTALTLFAAELKGGAAIRPGFIPSPSGGSACKRMALYLRWMVRKDDGIDLGVWKDVPASILVVPVDTHIERAARRNGWTERASADWKMAEEITAALRKFDPDDPVKYDFSLCHAEMINVRG